MSNNSENRAKTSKQINKALRETEAQRRRGTTSPDPEKIPEPLRGPLGGFPVGIPREEETPKGL